MISKIELKLIDDQGNYSVAYIDYRGFIDTLYGHNIHLIDDAFKSMVAEYDKKGRMEIKKKESAIESEVKEALLKEEGRRDQ